MKRILLCPLAALAVAATLHGIDIKTGDTVAFLGDSITQQGNASAGYVTMTIRGLAANNVAVKHIPAGISGNKSNDMLKRLQPILDRKPTAMTLSCGVNDVWHGKRGVPLEEYKKNITEIVDRTRKAGVKVYILTATMIREDQTNPYNQQLIAYNDFLRKLAKEKNCVLVDLNSEMQKQVAARHQKYPGARDHMLTYDGVHMAPTGNAMMARGVLKGFGLTDAELAKAEASWQGLIYAWGPIRLTVADYAELADKAHAQKKSVPVYLNELIRKNL